MKTITETTELPASFYGEENESQPALAKFTSPGRRAVTTENIRQAAYVFAERAARAEFGKLGDCRTCAMGSQMDGSSAEFTAFIEITKGHETTGHNISFTVYAI